MSLFRLLSLCMCCTISITCAKPSNENYVASNYIPDNVFTDGIEGPAVDDTGNLYAVNYGENGTIGLVTEKDHAQLFVRLPEGSIGNGIRFGTDGSMFVADYTGHNVLKIDMSTKAIRVHAHNSDMNQPNDLAITRAGVIYASDPDWQNSTGQLWRVASDGTSVLLESNMGTTNGVEVSADEKHLYVNESIQRKVWVYDILENGELSNKRLFIEFPDHGMDGMRCDVMGNLYIARYGKGVIAKVSPQGELLLEISLQGKFPTNVAFGGEGGKTLFVTLQKRGAIEYFRVEDEGRAFVISGMK